MSTAIMEAQLREALTSDPDLASRGWRGTPRQPGGVAVERAGTIAGLWRWRAGVFELSIGGSGAIVTFETVAEAVRHTRENLCPPP